MHPAPGRGRGRGRGRERVRPTFLINDDIPGEAWQRRRRQRQLDNPSAGQANEYPDSRTASHFGFQARLFAALAGSRILLASPCVIASHLASRVLTPASSHSNQGNGEASPNPGLAASAGRTTRR
jgi:hypothetical protein